ncbi:MAG: rhodanese-like domain-containing protein [Eubacterium sp.]|nr:rhodanese-like domain-containing protein [Eubacterium sp.]
MFDIVNMAEAMTAVSKGTAFLIDIRSKEAYRKGHLPGAVNIPLDYILKDDYKRFLPDYHTGRKMILYCDTGTGSLLAAKKLDRKGMEACSISGGLAGYKGHLDTGS